MNTRDLAATLAALDLPATINDQLRTEADLIADAIRDALSTAPGGDHTFPWRQTGQLRDSIQTTVSENIAVIGSTAPEAPFQEYGTRTDPPRPFLAPITGAHAESAGRAIGAAVAAAIASALKEP